MRFIIPIPRRMRTDRFIRFVTWMQRRRNGTPRAQRNNNMNQKSLCALCSLWFVLLDPIKKISPDFALHPGCQLMENKMNAFTTAFK
jgi:hypothetical protein